MYAAIIIITAIFAAGHPRYQQTSLYDGIVTEPDDYHQWFSREMGGKKPESGWPSLDMNSWRGAPYVYKNESLHQTAWVGGYRCVGCVVGGGRLCWEDWWVG